MLRRVMITTATLVVLGGVAIATGAPALSNADTGRTLPPTSWAFAIGGDQLDGDAAAVAERLGGFDLVVVDGEEASAEDVAALKAAGATVLGYLSVGTIEEWRSWYHRLKRYRLDPDGDWEGEWFANVSKRGLRREFTKRIAPSMLVKGFDGLFLDNVAMIENRDYREQRAGMTKLVAALGALVHSDGRLLFAQNGYGSHKKLGIFDSLDGWNLESVTWTYDFDRKKYIRNSDRVIGFTLDELRRAVAKGLIVTATDYTKAGDSAALAEAVANACGAGALPYVSDIGLSAARVPNPPLSCP